MVNFSIVKKGYEPREVDSYIKKLEDVILSYKEKDVAIKNAIISAQIAADNIVKNAELEAMSHKVKAIEDLKEIQINILSEKNKLDSFQREYSELINKYLINLDNNQIIKVNEKIDLIVNDFNNIHNKLTGNEKKDIDKKNEELEETKKIPILDEFRNIEG